MQEIILKRFSSQILCKYLSNSTHYNYPIRFKIKITKFTNQEK